MGIADISFEDLGWLLFDSEHVCYVVQAQRGGPFKVGNARCLSKRLPSIQNGNPYLLVPRALFTGGPHTEKQLHELLADHRMVGEWFAESAVPLLCAAMRSDTRLLWGQPWSDEDYKEMPPERCVVRARLREALLAPGTMAAIHEAASDSKHPAFRDCVRILERHAGGSPWRG